MIYRSKIKASAMQFAILISAIVAILLGCFLLLTYTHSLFMVQSAQIATNIEEANKGITKLFDPEFEVEDSIVIPIDGVPVELKSNFLGSYESAVSKGGAGSNSFTKAALLGSNTTENITGIYLENNHLPLVLAGNSRIEGDAYLPGNHVKAGNISGNYYNGTSLIYGKRYTSNEKLPALDPEWVKYIYNSIAFLPTPDDRVVKLKDLENSFFSERIYIYNEQKVFLDQQILGNVIIKSETEIEVSQYADLDQVLLIAPKVIFNPGFTGNIHAIAETIVVQNDVFLSYPSSLITVHKEAVRNLNDKEDSPSIRIGKNSEIQGNILYLNLSEETKSKTDIVVETGAVIEGQIYCQGYTELKGSLTGSLFTKYFVANEEGSIYINHIYNGKILTDEIQPEICGILFKNKRKAVASWLY